VVAAAALVSDGKAKKEEEEEGEEMSYNAPLQYATAQGQPLPLAYGASCDVVVDDLTGDDVNSPLLEADEGCGEDIWDLDAHTVRRYAPGGAGGNQADAAAAAHNAQHAPASENHHHHPANNTSSPSYGYGSNYANQNVQSKVANWNNANFDAIHLQQQHQHHHQAQQQQHHLHHHQQQHALQHAHQHQEGYLDEKWGLYKPSPSPASDSAGGGGGGGHVGGGNHGGNNHTSSASGGNDLKKPKSYQCSACDKWFTSSGHLKRHYNTTLHKNALRSKAQQQGLGRAEATGSPSSSPYSAMLHVRTSVHGLPPEAFAHHAQQQQQHPHPAAMHHQHQQQQQQQHHLPHHLHHHHQQQQHLQQQHHHSMNKFVPRKYC